MDKAIIAKVQGFGFDVYMRKPEDSWLYFTDGTRIGYLDTGGERGVFNLGTVHKPNTTTGTGFQVERHAASFTKSDLERCFDYAPAWASGSDRASVKKYRDMAEFLRESDWNRGYQRVEDK